MKNTLKKVIASAMAVASLTISAAGINVSATDTNAFGSTSAGTNDNRFYESHYFSLSDHSEHYLTEFVGTVTVHYAASVNQGGVTIVVRDSDNNYKDSHYISAGSSASFSIDVPSGKTYKFYAKSSTASPSYVISGYAYFY